MNDVRYAFRALQQNPAFALTAVVSIALAIGANATVFGIFDALIFRPLPVPQASQVVVVSSRSPSGTYEDVSWPDFIDLRDKNQIVRRLDCGASFSFWIRQRSPGTGKDERRLPGEREPLQSAAC